MYNYTYICPICGNEVELMDCPFDDSLVGKCKYYNLKIDILKEDYEAWKEEAKDDVDSKTNI